MVKKNGGHIRTSSSPEQQSIVNKGKQMIKPTYYE